MPHSVTNVFQFALLTMTSVFFLVDPFTAIPMFLLLTHDLPEMERRKAALRSSITCALALSTFGLAGSLIFKLFGITLPAFKIAGGIILLRVGQDMLQARQTTTKVTPEEACEPIEKSDASIIPLGIPMLAGPGAISTVMVLVGGAHTLWQQAIIYAAILITAFAAYLILASASRVRHYLGDTGIRILTRLAGLLLVALAVQFVINGLIDFDVVKALKPS